MDWLSSFIEHIFFILTTLGYWGILLGLMIEIIPSEVVLSYGGFLVSQGHIHFAGAVICGTIGGTMAHVFLYWIGKYGGRPFLEKYGKYLLITEKHLAVSEQWFERYGPGIVFTARFVPVVRHAISIPAGIVRMPLATFTLLTMLAVIPWSIFFIYLGKSLGANWHHIHEKAEPFVLPFILFAAALTIIYFFYKKMSSRAPNPGTSSAALISALASDAIAHANRAPMHPATLDDALEELGPEYVVLMNRHIRINGSEQTLASIIIGVRGVFFLEPCHGSENRLYRLSYVLKALLRQHHIQAPVIGLCYSNENEGACSPFQSVTCYDLSQTLQHYPAVLSENEASRIAQLLKAHSRELPGLSK